MACPKWILAAVILLLIQPAALSIAESEPEKSRPAQAPSAIEEIIPLTMGNLRGHQMLYNEGWYVITSSSKAFEYAREHSLASSRTALQRLAADAARHSSEYQKTIGKDARDSVGTGAMLVTDGTKLSGKLVSAAHDIAKTELVYADRSFQRAMDAIVRGNMTIAKRTEAERQELAGLPGNYFKTVKEDFSNLHDLAAQARQRFSGRIEPAWEASFQKASREFRSEYERSGNEHNSLMALGPILYGYLKSFYYGLAAPASKTIVKTTAAGTSDALFLPVTAASVVTGRTVQAVGLTVYYTGKTGIKIISPTIEGGLLSGLSLLSLSTVPVTYAAGGTLGAVNQVAFSTAGPVAATAEGIGSATVHSAGYVGFLAYDAVKGTTKVAINQAASGVVLGYNALTAVPTHAVMGAVDAAIFLAWDGPRLVIASAQGRLKTGDKTADQTYSLGDLPAGTVVDLRELEKSDGVKVEVLSTDSSVIRNVLEKIPDDVRAE